MPALFLTTAALEMALLHPGSRFAQFINTASPEDRWVSPLSHAILRDTFLAAPQDKLPLAYRRKGLRVVDDHSRRMRLRRAEYPYPNEDTVKIWGEIRSLNVNIPEYNDEEIKYPQQIVGPDELLVFATAAAFAIPLVGPMPIDNDVIDFLADNGVKFQPLMRTEG